MENRSHALAAGLFVLLLGIAAATAIWWFRQDKDELSYYLLETRDGVGGLNNEALVRYRGIRAGKVEDIGIDPKDKRLIVVRISLDKDIDLTQGTTATLTSQGITGLTYISLDDNGNNPAPLTAPSGELPRIVLQPALFDVLSDHAADMVKQLSAVMARLDRVLSDKNAANLERTIANAATASDGLKDLPEVVSQLRATMHSLEQTSDTARPMMTDIRKAANHIDDVAERLNTLMGSGADAQATLPRANALMKELSATTQQLSHLIEKLDDNPQSLIFGQTPARPGPGEQGFKP